MKNFKTNLFLVTLSLGLFFASCEKEEFNESLVVQNDIEQTELLQKNNPPTSPVVDYGNIQWLEWMEENGGHAIQEHWDQSQTYLLNRPGDATSFHFRETGGSTYVGQEHFISMLRSAFDTTIKIWYANNPNISPNNKSKWAQSFAAHRTVGWGYINGRWKAKIESLTVVVKWSTTVGAWILLTAYPAL